VVEYAHTDAGGNNMKTDGIKNIIVISDQQIGCRLALCPPEIKLDEGGKYIASPVQQKIWKYWNFFWDEWVPKVTKGENYVVVNNGDALENRHHNATTMIPNLADQKKLAEAILKPITNNPKCVKYYHIRGTEAHAGQAGEDEEVLAKTLGAEPDEFGNYSRWELWLRIGKSLINFSHHIGASASSNYESTAVLKELVEAFNDAGRWKNEAPDVVVRSHRHRQCELRFAGENGYKISFVTPCWQAKTPLSHRILSGRVSLPQIGGYLIRHGDEDEVYTRFKVWRIRRPQEVVI
jgi:hypothetical protein